MLLSIPIQILPFRPKDDGDGDDDGLAWTQERKLQSKSKASRPVERIQHKYEIPEPDMIYNNTVENKIK